MKKAKLYVKIAAKIVDCMNVLQMKRGASNMKVSQLKYILSKCDKDLDVMICDKEGNVCKCGGAIIGADNNYNAITFECEDKRLTDV